MNTKGLYNNKILYNKFQEKHKPKITTRIIEKW
jgi:hypothetical protein